MKIRILLIISLSILIGCKKSENRNIYYVSVQKEYYPNYADNSFQIDIDLDGDNDLQINKLQNTSTYYDEDLNTYITTSNKSIEFKNIANIEFASYNNCMSLFNTDQEISKDISYEKSTTLADDYTPSCNRVIDGKYFIGFRIKKESKWHYGWIQLDYDLDNNNLLTFDGWAFHLKKEKTIKTNQKE